MPPGVKDLKLWQEATALAADALRHARHAARRDSMAFLDRVIVTASGVAEVIADGYARTDALDQQRLFEGARRGLATLETQLAIARQAGLLPAEASAQLSGRATTVGRLLAGYLSYVERQRTGERDEGVLRISPAAAGSPLRKTLDEIYCA
jgi:four helix bundle protein